MYRFPTIKQLILETKYDFEIRPQINDWRQGNFRLSSGRRLRGAPGHQAFQDARKSAYLCGKMRVQFCLRKMNRLTKCNGDVPNWPRSVFEESGGSDEAEADISETFRHGGEKTSRAHHGLAMEKACRRMVSPVLLIKQSASIWHTLICS